MNIIEQLEQIVTPAVLGSQINNKHIIDGNHIDHGSVSYVSLLEQFYAILAARLALPQIYSQLLRDDEPIANENIVETPLFEHLWQAPSARQTIIDRKSVV